MNNSIKPKLRLIKGSFSHCEKNELKELMDHLKNIEHDMKNIINLIDDCIVVNEIKITEEL